MQNPGPSPAQSEAHNQPQSWSYATIPKLSLDIVRRVAVWLLIMRNRTVTHSADAAFHVLADPTRRAMLDLLRGGSLPAGAIARSFPISRPAVSKHLRLLRQARLVQERRSGRHRFYHLNPEPLKAVDRWLEQYRVFWNAKLGQLKAFVEADEAGKVGFSSKKKRRVP